jgi:hypothetical protein
MVALPLLSLAPTCRPSRVECARHPSEGQSVAASMGGKRGQQLAAKLRLASACLVHNEFHRFGKCRKCGVRDLRVTKQRRTSQTIYVYALVDPRDGRPFYVGKGRGDRAWQHARSSHLKKEVNSEKARRIAEIKAAGLSVGVTILAEGVTEIEGMRREREEIAKARKVGDITNLTQGDRHHLERALDLVNDILRRFKTLDQWARDLAARLGRPVTKDDYRTYIDALAELADQRALITQMMRE